MTLNEKLTDVRALINEIYEDETNPERLASRDCFRRYCSEIGDGLDKLKKLEEIEDELGVDLITLFKALKDGIWSKGGFYDACYLDAKPEFVPPDELEIGRQLYMQYDNDVTFQNMVEEENALCFYTHNYEEKVYSVRIKDYGKTWALTKEELL